MLRHYDKIGLLKPSMRSSNGYRWYSEQDLARLQQIIALKFFGFGLAQIKTMLQQPPEIYEHLNAQQRMLADQTEHLKQVQDALVVVLEQGKASGGSLNWNNLVSLIERYRMVDKLKDTWADTLSEKEKEGYIKTRQAYPKEVTDWEESIKAMNGGQLGDPEGPDGERAVNAFLKLLHVQAKLNAAGATEKMSKKDAAEMVQNIQKRMALGVPLSLEGSTWYARAVNAYHLRRWDKLYQDIAKNLDADPESEIGKKLAQQWREVVAENCPGGGSIDFHFGHTLLMNTVRDKSALQEASGIVQTPEEKQKTILNDLKMMSDPRATMWMLMALNKH
jgi:DNA-binding transcriptional MerR regulator